MRRRKSGLAEEVSSIWRSQIVRYVFFGGMTTFVNLGVYFVLRGIFFLSVTVSNIISVSSAVLFAYLVNSFFVFESRPNTWVTRGKEFIRFVSARLLTMALEVGGVWFMAEILKIGDMISKIAVQFIVLVLNYVFSRFLIFVQRDAANGCAGRK